MRQLFLAGKLAFRFFCGAFLLPHAAFAGSNAMDPQWLSLNYYHAQGSGRFTSEILNADFFVASDGQTNPEHELAQFKALMHRHAKGEPQTDILCRYPARMTFVQGSDLALRNFQRPVCADYITQNRPDEITSISLIFASGYFDNPGSYFGHTMLTYNYGPHTVDQQALDASLNYGANNTDVPSSPMYAIRGIFGGYEASYKRNNELLNAYQYTNLQIRDLWQYELALTPTQRQFLVEHSWEMMRAKFTYYFFNDNCAHRIARIIEKSTGKSLSDVNGFWLLPTQVVRHLKPDASPSLIAKETYLPSLKTQFSASYDALDAQQKKQLITYLEQPAPQQRTDASTLSPQLLRLALNHYDLELAKQKEEPEHAERIEAINEQRSILLLEMLRRTPASLTAPAFAAPHRSIPNSRPASSLRVDVGATHDRGVARVSYRAANNDLLDTPLSGQEVSRFLMGAAQVDVSRDKTSLRKLTAIEILNLNTNPLPMSLTNEFSWGLKVDYAPRTELCTDCSAAGIEAKFGRAMRMNKNLLFYGLAGARAHSEEQDTGSYANAVVDVGTVITASDTLAFTAAAQFTQDVMSDTRDATLSFEARQRLGERTDLRVNVATTGSEHLLTTGMAWYFD